jgi:hypothetical protein
MCAWCISLPSRAARNSQGCSDDGERFATCVRGRLPPSVRSRGNAVNAVSRIDWTATARAWHGESKEGGDSNFPSDFVVFLREILFRARIQNLSFLYHKPRWKFFIKLFFNFWIIFFRKFLKNFQKSKTPISFLDFFTCELCNILNFFILIISDKSFKNYF